MNTRLALAIGIALVTAPCLPATADAASGEVYRWVDKDGVVHFTDRQPGTTEAEQVTIQTDEPAGGDTTGDGPGNASQPATQAAPSYAQQRRDERAEKRREEAERRAAIEAACKQRRMLVERLEPSPRVVVEYEDGTVTRLDDEERLSVLNEAQEYISTHCADEAG